MSNRSAYLQKRYGRRYGRGARFLARCWDWAERYFASRVYGDHAIEKVMDQIVRVQKLGKGVITDEHRQATLDSMWEVLERIHRHGERGHRLDEKPQEETSGVSVEWMDYQRWIDSQDEQEPVWHEEMPEPEPVLIPEELCPVRHSQEAWESFLTHMEDRPEEFITVYRVLWQLWRLRNGANFLSWIS